MATVYHGDDATMELIQGRRVAVIGYGNQGHAHALNLRDSGCEVRIGLRPRGPSWSSAEGDGFPVLTVADAAAWADVIGILLPDQYHKQVFEESIRRQLEPGNMLLVAHGFSIHFGQIQSPPDVDVAMVAPVGPGHMMRRLFKQGSGIPALIAVHQDVTGDAHPLSLSYARALGSTRVGVLRTTFQEETETDLFGEQAVLCGGMSALIKTGFETLVKAGYQPELAYFECVHQVKLIVDLLYEGGFSYMHSRISDTAEFGDYISESRVIDQHVSRSMDAILEDIQDGSFARRWISEYEHGMTTLHRKREEERGLQIEVVGARLRSMMAPDSP